MTEMTSEEADPSPELGPDVLRAAALLDALRRGARIRYADHFDLEALLDAWNTAPEHRTEDEACAVSHLQLCPECRARVAERLGADG